MAPHSRSPAAGSASSTASATPSSTTAPDPGALPRVAGRQRRRLGRAARRRAGPLGRAPRRAAARRRCPCLREVWRSRALARCTRRRRPAPPPAARATRLADADAFDSTRGRRGGPALVRVRWTPVLGARAGRGCVPRARAAAGPVVRARPPAGVRRACRRFSLSGRVERRAVRVPGLRPAEGWLGRLIAHARIRVPPGAAVPARPARRVRQIALFAAAYYGYRIVRGLVDGRARRRLRERARI